MSGYSIHGKVPTPQLVRFETDRPALLDRYDDVRILRQILLLHQRQKIPPNENILKQLKKKKRGLKKTKNLRGEVSQIRTQQKRFERGERRDRPEQEPRIIGEPIRGAGGIAFDPEIEREKLQVEREKILLGQGRLALDGRQLNINRQLAGLERLEQARQFNELLHERQERDRQQLQIEDEARRERIEAEAAERGERLAVEDRARREALEFEERRQQQAAQERIAELETRLVGEEAIVRENRNAEFRQLEERNRFELAREVQARQAREQDIQARDTALSALERARTEQVGLLREQGDLNRDIIQARVSELDREREQRRDQREADFLQRGLHEINAVIDRRIDEARREFRRGLADPEPEITILGGARRARAETTPQLSPQERADLSAEIASTIREQLQRSPRDIVREQGGTVRASPSPQRSPRGSPSPRLSPEEQARRYPQPAGFGTGAQRGGGGPIRGARELTPEEQRRVEATRAAVARRSPSPQGGRSRSPRRAVSPTQTEREARAEQEFYERQPSPGRDIGGLSPATQLSPTPSPLDEIPAERLRRGGGRGTAQYSSEDSTSVSTGDDSGELIFSIDADDTTAEQQEGLLAGGARLLQQAGGAVLQGASHVIERGQQAVEDYRRPGIGEQTGGRLDPEGTIVGLGQEIEAPELEPEPPAGDFEQVQRPAIPPVITAAEVIERAENPQATAEAQALEAELQDIEAQRQAERQAEPARGRVEEVPETPVGGGAVGSIEEGALIEEVEQEGRGVSGAAQRSNYSEYQALRGDLDELASRRGGKRKAGVEEFIPFEITNVSDKTLKKIEPGQTIQLKGVLRGGEIRYVVPGTLKSTKIQKQVLDKLIREGKLKISRKV